MNTLRFLIPFTYFFKSRLQQVRDIIFHFYYEWLIGFLLLFHFLDYDLFGALKGYLLCYIAFISLYEIGYLGNDVFSVRNETDPRLRIKNFNPTNSQLVCWVIIRLIVFSLISVHLKVISDFTWQIFFLCLAVFFLLHNIIKQK